ncbi:hypothetical protein NDU88_002711 [Pleurodeles waltl]|uniref:Uncharacterized protein n=1 Tax=Pleurodeles waltl TaxID=8319 RepID=A0AAV7W049_PLEWA|nr:hypothetical protein NDU88_002711 [Pleurodeles waltl]
MKRIRGPVPPGLQTLRSAQSPSRGPSAPPASSPPAPAYRRTTGRADSSSSTSSSVGAHLCLRGLGPVLLPQGTTTAARQVLRSRASSPSSRGRSVVDEAPPPRLLLPHRARLECRPPGPSNSLFWSTHCLFGSAHSAEAAVLRSGARGAASAPGRHLCHRTGPSRLRVRDHHHVEINRSPGSQLAREPAGAIGGVHQDGIVKASTGG